MAGTITDKGLERLRQQLLNRGVSADGAVVREIVGRGKFNVLDDYCEVEVREGTGTDVTVYRQIPDEQVVGYVTQEQIGERRSYAPASERAGTPAPPPDEAPSEEIELSEGDFDEGDAPGLEAVPARSGTGGTFARVRSLEERVEGAAGPAAEPAEPLTPEQKYAERRKLVEEFVKATESYDLSTAGEIGAKYYSLLEEHFPGLSLQHSTLSPKVREQTRASELSNYSLAVVRKLHDRIVEPTALFDVLEKIAVGYQKMTGKPELVREKTLNRFMEVLSSVAQTGYTAPVCYLYPTPGLVEPFIDEILQRYEAHQALPIEQRTTAEFDKLLRLMFMADVETRTYLEQLRQTLEVPEYPEARERQRELEREQRKERGIEPVEPARPNLGALEAEVPGVPAAASAPRKTSLEERVAEPAADSELAEPLTPEQKYAERRKLVEEFVKATKSYECTKAGEIGARYYSLLEKHFPGLSLEHSARLPEKREQTRASELSDYALAVARELRGRIEPTALFEVLEKIAISYQNLAGKPEQIDKKSLNSFMELLSSIAQTGYTTPLYYLHPTPGLVGPFIDEIIRRYETFCALPREEKTTEELDNKVGRLIRIQDVETRTYLEQLRQTLGVPEYPEAREKQRELERERRKKRGLEPVEPFRPNPALLKVPEVPAAATVPIEAVPPEGTSTYTTDGHTATDGIPEPPPAEGVAPPAATSAGPAPTETTAVPPPEGAAPPAGEPTEPPRKRRQTIDGLTSIAEGVDLTTEQNGRKRTPPPVPPAKPKPSRSLWNRAAYAGAGLLGALVVWYAAQKGAEYLSNRGKQPFPTPVTAAYHDAGVTADAQAPGVTDYWHLQDELGRTKQLLQGTLYYQILRNLTNPQELEQLAIRYLKEVKLGLPLTVKADSCAQAWERFFTLMTESNRVGLQASGLSADLTEYTHTRTKFGEKLSQQCKRDGGDYYRFSVGVEKPMRRKQR